MIIAVDTETEGLDCTKFLCGAIAFKDKKTEIYKDKEQMWQRINGIIESEWKRDKRTYIYAHNHQYDWNAYAKEHMFEPGLRYTFYPFLITKLADNGKAKAFFLDTFNIYKMPLEELGKLIGLPKLRFPHGETKFSEDGKLRPENGLEEYCKRDAEIALKAVYNIKKTLNDIGIKPRKVFTAGQLAMCGFMAYCKREGIWEQICEPFDNQRIRQTRFPEKMRTAYRGARAEAFQTGRFKDITMIDVNSLYPYIMANMRFPDLRTERYNDFSRTPDKLLSTAAIKYNKLGIAKVRITIPKIDIGYLPIRYRKRQIFPNKEGLIMESTWTIQELAKAITLGYKIEDIEYMIIYDDMKNPLKEYINKIYELKKNGSTETRNMAKMLMNNLYGKFAQRPERKEMKFIYRDEILKPEYEGWKVEGTMGPKYAISKTETGKPSYFVNPIISILVTATARDFMYNRIKMISRKDLLYTDTDSIVMKNWERYKDIFPIGDEMGQWKEDTINSTIEILGEKKYHIKGRMPRVSGITKKEKTEKAFKEREMTTQRMITIKQGLRTGREIGRFQEQTMKLGTGKKSDIHITEKEISD